MRGRIWPWLAMIPSSIIAGALVPILLTSAALPSNSWIGLRAGNTGIDGILASCALSSATGTDSVWVASAGWHSLDIVQVGAQVTPSGPRYFAAWGAGDPGAPGSSYTERDLGPATTAAHRYTVQRIGSSFALSIDGTTRLTVPVPAWAQVSVQVQNEVMTVERMGPVACSGSRVHYAGSWLTASWQVSRNGPAATSASVTWTTDGFRVS